ncbi:MAG: peptide deformylase [Legionellales bacterium]|nr:peptide deformylase [Legionellales bacterium]
MAIRDIIFIPDPRLRQVCDPVTSDEFDDALQTLIDDMFETMYHAPGVGLAANQIGITKSLAVIDVVGSEQPADQYVIINPKIIDSKGEVGMSAGCLSVPHQMIGTVKRAEWVKVAALDRFGNPIELEGDGLFGHCLQHEIDHLNGIVFVDRLSTLKRERMLAKIGKLDRLITKQSTQDSQ